jgi:CMP-N-acetylneuraminic acid synthetase
MKVLGVIPARGGSKRLPNKNISDLGGHPLIAWTISVAQKSGVFDKIVVSTDSDDIETIAVKYGVEVLRRPPDLSKDDTPTYPVIKHVFEKYPYDVVVTLQCTSPFRLPSDITEALELLKTTNGHSVVSVIPGPSDLAFEVGHAKRLRNIPKIMICNGALYLLTRKAIETDIGWYDGVLYGYEMPKERSLDIDTMQDLYLATHLVEKGIFTFCQ